MNDDWPDLTRLARRALLSAAVILAASPAKGEPICDAVKKYVTGKAAIPFMGNRGAPTGPNQWKARRPIEPGDCTVVSGGEVSSQFVLACMFNNGGDEPTLSSYYGSSVTNIQTCLDGLDTHFDWRKRDASRTEDDGRVVKETRWIWTTLRDRNERQIWVSSSVGGAQPSNNYLMVLWRSLDKK